MDELKIILFYGGDAATTPREHLLNWLRTPRVKTILGRPIDARKVGDSTAHSEGSIDTRVSDAIAWADLAIALITPDTRGEHGAPNVIEEIGRWREKKRGTTLAIIRHHTVPIHSNQAGVVYIDYHDHMTVVDECREQLLAFLQDVSRNQSSDLVGSSILPAQPSLLIGRDHDIQQLKTRLRTMQPTQVLTAMHGWPGVGKTTLAAALAHDPEIASRFEGVLWASLGQQPSLFGELSAWGRALGVPDLHQARTLEEASQLLRGLLRTRRYLLIVDDAWRSEHIVPFNVGGSGCALLITTRLPEVARAIASTPDGVYILGILRDTDALELLRALAPSVVAEHATASQELVRDLEGLPLAIQVAGRLLHAEHSYGFGITELLEDIREGAKLIEAQAPADRTEVARETTPTVAALLQKSTDLLNEDVLVHFAYLGAFAPKPATFDTDAMQAVWQVADPKPTIRILLDRGLLEPTGEQRFWMHAILVAHARSFLTD